MTSISPARARVSATRAGWQAITRTPALIACEIAWRWAFWIAFWVVVIHWVRTSLIAVQVSPAEYAAIKALQPLTTGLVLAEIVQALWQGFQHGGVVVTIALVLLWTFAATVGRVATLKTLIPSAERVRWGAVAGINLMRVLVTFAALTAVVGAAILIARNLPTQGEPTVILAQRVLLMIASMTLIGSVWSLLNWFLSLAPIFVVQDQRNSFLAIRDSLHLFADQKGPYTSTALWLAACRFGVMMVFSFAAGVPLQMFTLASRPVEIAAVSLILAAGYFAIMDIIQVWRIAAYASLAPEQQALETAVSVGVAPSEGGL